MFIFEDPRPVRISLFAFNLGPNICLGKPLPMFPNSVAVPMHRGVAIKRKRIVQWQKHTGRRKNGVAQGLAAQHAERTWRDQGHGSTSLLLGLWMLILAEGRGHFPRARSVQYRKLAFGLLSSPSIRLRASKKARSRC